MTLSWLNTLYNIIPLTPMRPFVPANFITPIIHHMKSCLSGNRIYTVSYYTYYTIDDSLKVFWSFLQLCKMGHCVKFPTKFILAKLCNALTNEWTCNTLRETKLISEFSTLLYFFKYINCTFYSCVIKSYGKAFTMAKSLLIPIINVGCCTKHNTARVILFARNQMLHVQAILTKHIT